MRPKFVFPLAGLLLLACIGFYAASDGKAPATSTPAAGNIAVYFSPNGGCADAIVNALDGAKSTVLVQAYSFTSAPIAKAVVDAHKRGVKVQVILDKSQRTEKYSSADFVAHAGIPTFIDEQHKIAHNKIMIIDDQTVITGSFNFTKSGEESNAENLLVIQGKELAKTYTENWQAHLKHSVAYGGRSLPTPLRLGLNGFDASAGWAGY